MAKPPASRFYEGLLKMSPTIKVAFVVLFIVLLASVHCFLIGSKWKFVTPMPHGRFWHDAVLGPDGKIYVMGGMVFKVEKGFKKGKTLDGWSIKKYNDGFYSNLVYEPGTDTWAYARCVPGWASDPGFIYAFDPKKDTWAIYNKKWTPQNYKINMDDPHCIYYKTDPKTREKIDILLKEIKKPGVKIYKTDLERQGVGVAVVMGKGGQIYWLGGKGLFIGRGEKIVLPYDPVKDDWPKAANIRIKEKPGIYKGGTVYKTDMPEMLEVRLAHDAVTASDGKIYAMGGMHYNIGPPHGEIPEASDTMECYDPATNKWTYKKKLKAKRMKFATVIGADDKIYLFGGAAGDMLLKETPVLNTVEVYDPKTDEWTYRSPMPEPRKSHAAVYAADGRIYILGGSKGADLPPLKTVSIYDPRSDTWEKGPDMKVHRASLAAVATPDGKIYAIGGTDRGAYEARDTINVLLPRKLESYSGKVQDTVEVLDVK